MMPCRQKKFLALAALLIWGGSLSLNGFAAGEAEPAPEPQDMANRGGAFLEAQILLNKKKWPEATLVLQGIYKQNPYSFWAGKNLARALFYSGRREEALEQLVKSTLRESGREQREYKEMLKVIGQTFLLQKTQAIYQEGLTLLGTSKVRQGREQLEKVIDAEPDNVQALLRLGQSLVLDAEYAQAVGRLKFAKKLDPFEAETRIWLARALHKIGDLKGAAEEFQSALMILKSSERLHLWYADFQLELGQPEGAATTLEDDFRKYSAHSVSYASWVKLKTDPRWANAIGHPWGLARAKKEIKNALSRLQRGGALGKGNESTLGLDSKEIANLLQAELLVRTSKLGEE